MVLPTMVYQAAGSRAVRPSLLSVEWDSPGAVATLQNSSANTLLLALPLHLLPQILSHFLLALPHSYSTSLPSTLFFPLPLFLSL